MIGYHVKKEGAFAHLTLAERLIAAYDEIAQMGLQPALQIYVTGPQSSNVLITEEDIARLAAWPHRSSVVIHGAYIDAPWKLMPTSIANIRAEMTISDRIGATGVVVHLPSLTGGLANIAKALERIANPAIRSTMWLEIKAAKTTDGTFETPEKIAELFAGITALESKPKCGLCIDTQHLYACGVSFREYTTTRKWLKQTRKLLPPEYPIMIHLNDSQSKLGSGVDRHENLTRGEIWRGFGPAAGDEDISGSGIMALLIWAEAHNVMVILETPEPKADLEIIRATGAMTRA